MRSDDAAVASVDADVSASTGLAVVSMEPDAGASADLAVVALPVDLAVSGDVIDAEFIEAAPSAAPCTPGEVIDVEVLLPSLRERVAKVFNQTLPGVRPGYAPRKGQMLMADAVADAIDGQEHLIVEGPCGVGKSLAYLIPAILHADKYKRTVIVVTATIALQEQLVKIDLPDLAKSLASELEEPLTWSLLKGRSNYYCHHKGHDDQASFDMNDAETLASIDAWAHTSKTGDRAELPFTVRDDIWRMRSVDSDDCLRDGCDFFKSECRPKAAKARAHAVRVLVINYHVLFANVALRVQTGRDVIIPVTVDDELSDKSSWDTIICDETHEAADIARDFLGCDIHESAMNAIVKWLNGYAGRRAAFDFGDALLRSARSLWEKFESLIARSRGTDAATGPARPVQIQAPIHVEDVLNFLRRVRSAVSDEIDRISEMEKPPKNDRQKLRLAENVRRKIDRLLKWIGYVQDPMGPNNVVMWLESYYDRSGRERAVLVGRTVKIGDILQKHLWGRTLSVIAASATITTGATKLGEVSHGIKVSNNADPWAWLRRQMGLADDVATLAVQSPFNFAKQSLLVVPRGAPVPGNTPEKREVFDRYVCDAALLTAMAAKGRTLVLCTSTRMAQRVGAYLREQSVPYPVLVQGEMPRSVLVDKVKQCPSILCGTSSLWTGLDLPGETIVAVVIDKLPFPSPDDPVLKALGAEALERTGDEWAGWREESLPRATLALRQGVGRLIRSVSDWGAVVLCDGRMTTARYGSGLVRALGMPTIARDFNAMEAWFKKRDAGAPPPAPRHLPPRRPQAPQATGR